MKKLVFLLLIVLLISCTNIDDKYFTFKENIRVYKSYNEEYLDKYYNLYKDNNSYIQTLNTINYPNFYYEKSNQLYYDNIILVNKLHGLNKNFIPNSLVKVDNINFVKRENETMYIDSTTLTNLINMFDDAKKHNINLLLYSAYRSYDKQLSLWKDTPTFEDLYKAVPGYSEHQTGLGVDISTKDNGLTTSLNKAYNYLENNAHRFGFILRYPKDKTSITGYAYEPWHFRYVGDISTFIYQNNLTLEEYIYNYVEIK